MIYNVIFKALKALSIGSFQVAEAIFRASKWAKKKSIDSSLLLRR